MDDHKNTGNEQPTTIFQGPPVEEVASTVESAVPEEIVDAADTVGPPPGPMMMEDNRHKFLLIGGGVLFFLLIFGLILFFILPKGKATAGVVKLTYWGVWEDKETIQPLIDSYKKTHPNVQIEYTKMSAQDSYREKILARSKNGQGPDIFRFHNTWKYELTDVLSPLPSTVMSNAEFDKTFYKIHQQDMKIGDHYYGIPLYIDGLVLIYNANMLKDVGVAQAPTNWEDVISIAKKLNPTIDSEGRLLVGAIALGTANNVDHFSDILGLMLMQNGGDIHKLDSKEAADTLESYRFFAEGKSKLWDETLPNSVTAFTQEKVAMIIAPSWEVLVIKQTNPDLEIKVVPVPNVPGAKTVSVANYWAEGVSKYSKNQLEAWNFLKFLSQQDSLAQLYENQAKVRLFGTAYSRVDMAAKLAQNPYLGAVIKEADSFVSLPVIERTYDNGLNDGIIQYLTNAVNASTQGVAYNEAMSTASKGVNQLLDQFGYK